MNASNNSTTFIAKNTTIVGDLHSKHGLYILGNITGELSAPTIFIDKNANYSGNIISKHIKIAGYFEDDINAHKVEILTSAKVTGNIGQKTISVETGAILNVKITSNHR
ncbi:MAG: polymer-forming cytoskeletal protein [Rhizobiales bacterium]|nr:polymer-forming cytoskeletal protein [Hyphomicrobiales bacterium]